MKTASLLILLFASSTLAGITPGPVILDGDVFPTVADVDGNGLDDLIQGRSVLLNYGGGQFTPHDLGLAASDRVVDSLDLNGDGRPDLLTENLLMGALAPHSYRVYLAGPQMNYGTSININTGGTSSPYIADVNGDGKDDLVLMRVIFQGGVREMATEVTVLLSRGDGTFGSRVPFQIAPKAQFGRYGRHLLSADVNRDGITDIVIRTVYELVVLRGTGGGDFTAETRFLPNEPFGWWSTGLADIDSDGNLDVVLAGFRSVRVLFGNGRGSFTRVSTAFLKRQRDIAVPDYLAKYIGDRAQAPRNFAIGAFVAAGRKEIAAGTAEGDVVILAYEHNKLQEVARTPTEFALPDIFPGAFRQPGPAADLYMTWNLGYGAPDSPKPRVFYSQPSFAANAAMPSGARTRASRPPASSLTFSLKTSGVCVPADANAVTMTKDGIFGLYRSAQQTLETVVDDEGMMHVRLDALWLTSWIGGTLSATSRGYEGTAAAFTTCGQQSVSFIAETK